MGSGAQPGQQGPEAAGQSQPLHVQNKLLEADLPQVESLAERDLGPSEKGVGILPLVSAAGAGRKERETRITNIILERWKITPANRPTLMVPHILTT